MESPCVDLSFLGGCFRPTTEGWLTTAAPASVTPAHLGLVQESIHSEGVGVWPHHDGAGWDLGQAAGLELVHLRTRPIEAQQLVVLLPELGCPGLRSVAWGQGGVGRMWTGSPEPWLGRPSALFCCQSHPK